MYQSIVSCAFIQITRCNHKLSMNFYFLYLSTCLAHNRCSFVLVSEARISGLHAFPRKLLVNLFADRYSKYVLIWSLLMVWDQWLFVAVKWKKKFPCLISTCDETCIGTSQQDSITPFLPVLLQEVMLSCTGEICMKKYDTLTSNIHWDLGNILWD